MAFCSSGVWWFELVDGSGEIAEMRLVKLVDGSGMNWYTPEI